MEVMPASGGGEADMQVENGWRVARRGLIRRKGGVRLSDKKVGGRKAGRSMMVLGSQLRDGERAERAAGAEVCEGSNG